MTAGFTLLGDVTTPIPRVHKDREKKNLGVLGPEGARSGGGGIVVLGQKRSPTSAIPSND